MKPILNYDDLSNLFFVVSAMFLLVLQTDKIFLSAQCWNHRKVAGVSDTHQECKFAEFASCFLSVVWIWHKKNTHLERVVFFTKSLFKEV